MKVTGFFTLKDDSKVVDGVSLWEDNISHKVDDILVCGEKQWRIVDVSHIFQGCFVAPKWRDHSVKLEPIDHNDLPNIGDVLIKS